MIPEDVRLVMNGWLTSRSQLALAGHLLGFTVTLRCRVDLLTDTGVELSTSDGGRIGVDLADPTMEFRYAEPREFPEIEVTEEQGLASSLTALRWRRFGADGKPSSEPESLYLIELVE
jgi:hypothetical protein